MYGMLYTVWDTGCNTYTVYNKPYDSNLFLFILFCFPSHSIHFIPYHLSLFFLSFSRSFHVSVLTLPLSLSLSLYLFLSLSLCRQSCDYEVVGRSVAERRIRSIHGALLR
jgi:hypothetical protein